MAKKFDSIDKLVEQLIEISDPITKGAGSNKELLASYIADQIVQMVIIDRFYMHSIKDIRYNDENESLLLVLHSNFNDHVQEILEMIVPIKAVKDAKAFERCTEEGFKYFVIKVTPDFDLATDGCVGDEYATQTEPTTVNRYGDITQFGQN